jgi:hypothetical protein
MLRAIGPHRLSRECVIASSLGGLCGYFRVSLAKTAWRL